MPFVSQHDLIRGKIGGAEDASRAGRVLEPARSARDLDAGDVADGEKPADWRGERRRVRGRELDRVARLGARTAISVPAATYTFGPFRLDVVERTLRREGVAVPLPPKGFDLLALLASEPGHLAEKPRLMSAL